MNAHLRIATGHQYEYIEFDLEDYDRVLVKELINDYHNIAVEPVPIKKQSRKDLPEDGHAAL